MLSSSKKGHQDKHPTDFGQLSHDQKLNKLLNSVLKDVKGYAEDQIRRINQLVQVGIALSVEKDVNKILEMIVDEARSLSNADAGTLYILDKKNQKLCFMIVQNDSMKIRTGGTSGAAITFPDIPLYHRDGSPNHSNVSSYVALTGQTINIADVYQAEGFDFTGPRNFDQATGYRSKSMLVIALKNHEKDIIGVLQLLNAQDAESNEIIPFTDKIILLVSSLASQAAITLTNNELISNLNELFLAFIKSIAVFVDKKSIYTWEHIRRVVFLTNLIAKTINQSNDGPFKNFSFTDEEMQELSMAAWMHDIGKVTTPEYVLDKSSRLETIFDRIELIEMRFQLIAQTIENRYLKNTLNHIQSKRLDTGQIASLKEKLKQDIRQLRKELHFIKNCNKNSKEMTAADIRILKQIAQKTFVFMGQGKPYLTPDEFDNLSVPVGTLTDREREIIQHHVSMTKAILDELPFPKSLANVAQYAGSHHERLDGSGYPDGLKGEQLAMQSRILAVADIFESLTATNRPYRKPMKLSKALDVLKKMKEQNQIDGDVVDLFIKQELYLPYAHKELDKDQIDEHCGNSEKP